MKTCLVTGGTGFLGSEIVAALKSVGYHVDTIGRSSGNTLQLDLSLDAPKLDKAYDLIIHCAGLAHYYPKNQSDDQKFYRGHVELAKNLITGLRKNSPKALVFISSVAVYGLDEGMMVSESRNPSPNTPYGRSKLEAEQILLSWGAAMQVPVTILRLPLVVGIKAPGNLGRMVSAMKRRLYFGVKNCNPQKSVVLASDVARFLAVDFKTKHGVYNLTDGHNPSLREIEDCIIRQFNLSSRPPLMPLFILKVLGRLGDFLPIIPLNSIKVQKLTTSLTFSDALARQEIGWRSTSILSGWHPLK